MVMKIIPASDMVEGSKKKSKIVKKSLGDKLLPGPIKGVIDLDKKPDVGKTDNKIDIKADVKPDVDVIVSDSKTDVGDVSGRTIRAIKLKEGAYYGPNDINKKQFVKMYKSKKLDLKWTENTSIGGAIVSCWINKDRNQYIIKLLEEGGYKRFKFYGCEEIYDYFISLGAIPFDYTKENATSPSYLSNYNEKGATDVIEGKTVECVSDIEEDRGFVGADLWSGYRTRQMLKGMPDNWGIKWK